MCISENGQGVIWAVCKHANTQACIHLGHTGRRLLASAFSINTGEVVWPGYGFYWSSIHLSLKTAALELLHSPLTWTHVSFTRDLECRVHTRSRVCQSHCLSSSIYWSLCPMKPQRTMLVSHTDPFLRSVCKYVAWKRRFVATTKVESLIVKTYTP